MPAVPAASGTGLSVAYLLATSAGGTGAHVALLARGCAARGAAVTVYGPATTGRRFFHDREDFSPASAEKSSRSWSTVAGARAGFVPVEIADRPRPVRDLVAVLRLRRLLAGPAGTAPAAGPVRACPVVHAHGLRAGAAGALALALLPPRRRPALLVTVHNGPQVGRLARLLYGGLERLTARRADAVTCVSSDLTDRMRRLGARDGGRALVPAPVRPAPAAAAVAALRASLSGAPGGGSAVPGRGRAVPAGGLAPGGPPGRPVVLAAGRLAPQKGFDVLLAAAARWQWRSPVPQLVIAGEGPLAGRLQAQARAARVDARFLGYRDDMPALLAAADVVAVPSQWEGQPLIVQEALRAGCALVAARAGGIPELTGPDGALLVSPGDPGRLAEAVAAVLADEGLRARLRAAARARAAALPSEADAIGAALAGYRRLAGAAPCQAHP